MKNTFATLHNTQGVIFSPRYVSPFKEASKYIQESRHFSTTGYCASFGCQNSCNCYNCFLPNGRLKNVPLYSCKSSSK